VQQIATPITVDSLAYLSDSNWPLASILSFAVNSLTPGYEDYFSALNAIIELDEYGALVLAAQKSDWTSPADRQENKPGARPPGQAGPAAGGTNKPVSPNDALVLYLEPDHPVAPNGDVLQARRRILHLWIRLLRIYAGTQPQAAGKDLPAVNANVDETDASVDKMDDPQLTAEFQALRNWIELRTAPIPPIFSRPPTEPARISRAPLIPPSTGRLSLAPLLRTRSALGILKFATELQSPLIEFVMPEDHDLIDSIRRNCPWNQWNNKNPAFYTLVTCDKAAGGTSDCSGKTVITAEDWVRNCGYHQMNLYTMHIQEKMESYLEAVDERALGHLRRYILVFVTDYPPLDAYVSISEGGKWYYIAGDDSTSKTNFTLLAQFLTMQAIPPTNAPLTPTLSVGRPGG
jgi:hypothetical protein